MIKLTFCLTRLPHLSREAFQHYWINTHAPLVASVAETLMIRRSEYIEAVQVMGASPWRIVLRHIMPLCVSSVIVRVTLDMAGIIITAAGLGFLGLGAQPPSPEWGAMIASGRRFILDQWWVAFFPGMAICLAGLGFNLLGDGLRDVLDPKQR